jgi:hypothetical protein
LTGVKIYYAQTVSGISVDSSTGIQMITSNSVSDTSSSILTSSGYIFKIPNSYTGKSQALTNQNKFMIGGATYSGGVWTPVLFHFFYSGSASTVTTISFSGSMSSSSRVSFNILERVGSKLYVSASVFNVIYLGELTFSSDW